MGSINERLVLLISTLNLNNNSFAKELGVSPTVTYNIIGGRFSKPSYDLLEKIISTFDNVNPNWLMKGDGDMFLKRNEITKFQNEKIMEIARTPKNSGDLAEKTIDILKEQLDISNHTNSCLLMANSDLLVILKNITNKA